MDDPNPTRHLHADLDVLPSDGHELSPGVDVQGRSLGVVDLRQRLGIGSHDKTARSGFRHQKSGGA